MPSRQDTLQRQGGGSQTEAWPAGAAEHTAQHWGPSLPGITGPVAPTPGVLGLLTPANLSHSGGSLGGGRQLNATGGGPGCLPTAGATARQPSNCVHSGNWSREFFPFASHFLSLPFPPWSCKTQKIDLCLKRRR